MGKIVKVKNGKGEVFKIDEDLLNGEPCQLSESEIEHLPKLDINWFLSNGYITADDYRNKTFNILILIK